MGKMISEACHSLFNEWKCEDNICGTHTAACVSLQTLLNHRLLWFACCHHVDEVILTRVGST